MKVKLWLFYYQNVYLGGPSQMFWKDLITPAVPDRGDLIVLYSHDEPDDGPLAEVKRRTWGVDGAISIELRPYVIDATDSANRENMSVIRRGGDPLFDLWSSLDGEPRDLLLPRGWHA